MELPRVNPIGLTEMPRGFRARRRRYSRTGEEIRGNQGQIYFCRAFLGRSCLRVHREGVGHAFLSIYYASPLRGTVVGLDTFVAELAGVTGQELTREA
jgi:hypothetical protein